MIKKAIGRIKSFMDKKIQTAKEMLCSAKNRAVIGIIMVGAGIGLVVSAYVQLPA